MSSFTIYREVVQREARRQREAPENWHFSDLEHGLCKTLTGIALGAFILFAAASLFVVAGRHRHGWVREQMVCWLNRQLP